MAKLRAWSSAPGAISIFFLIAGITGAVFQFIWLYLPYFQIASGDWQGIMFFAFSIAAMAFGAFTLILSLIGITRAVWIIFTFLVIGFTLVLPVWIAIDTGIFVYVVGDAATNPFLLVIPTNPLFDFIGFWLAAGGSFLAMFIGFFIPKEF